MPRPGINNTLHAVERPKQVDRRRPAGLEAFDGGRRVAGLRPEDDAVSGGHSDRRSPPNLQAANGLPDVVDRAAVTEHDLAGKSCLVEEPQEPVGPPNPFQSPRYAT